MSYFKLLNQEFDSDLDNDGRRDSSCVTACRYYLGSVGIGWHFSLFLKVSSISF